MEPLSFDNPAETKVVEVPYVRKVFLYSPRPGLDPDTSPTATARSSHSATEVPQQGQPPNEIHPVQ